MVSIRLGGAVLAVLALTAFGCTPRVAIEAPNKPITINLNIKLDADVKVRLEETAKKDIESNPNVF